MLPSAKAMTIELGVFVGLLARFDTRYHVGFRSVDQLVGQALQTVGERCGLSGLDNSRLRRATGADQFHDPRYDFDEAVVVLPEFAEQLDFVLCNKLQSIHVVAELIELAKRARQRLLVRRDERGGNTVELGGGVVLNLTIGLDLALQLDEFLGALIDPAQDLEPHGSQHDQQEGDGEECRKQLELHAGRNPCNQADERAEHPHYRSLQRLKRSRRNSSGSKWAPRYWTRRMPRGSTIEVRNVWSTSPFAAFDT